MASCVYEIETCDVIDTVKRRDYDRGAIRLDADWRGPSVGRRVEESGPNGTTGTMERRVGLARARLIAIRDDS